MHFKSCSTSLSTSCRPLNPKTPLQGPANPGEPVAVADVIQYAHYFGRVVEELMAVLFDLRRHNCHSRVLNYIVAGGGLIVQQFAALQQVLWLELSLKEGSQQEGEHLLALQGFCICVGLGKMCSGLQDAGILFCS